MTRIAMCRNCLRNQRSGKTSCSSCGSRPRSSSDDLTSGIVGAAVGAATDSAIAGAAKVIRGDTPESCQRNINNELINIYNRSVRAKARLPEKMEAVAAAHALQSILDTLHDDLSQLINGLRQDKDQGI